METVMTPEKLKILIIDDEPNIRIIMSDFFEFMGHEPITAADGREGIEKIDSLNPDFVFVDLNMPVLDGFAVITYIKENYPFMPVVVISGAGLVQDAMSAVRAGAWDFITKPVADLDVVYHIFEKTYDKAYLMHENEDYKNNLEKMVGLRTYDLTCEVEKRRMAEQTLIRLNSDIINTQKEILWVLGEVVETRSKETGNHVKRVAEISNFLAHAYGLKEKQADELKHASPMHDIGKIGIDDDILNKPGKLTPEEYSIIQTHTTIGYQILSKSAQSLMQVASIVAYEHHEWWNGDGYPRGLKGEQIHIYGRITCIADIFDALSTKRIYKEAWDKDRIISYINDNKGIIFEPKLVNCFNECLDEILKLY